MSAPIAALGRFDPDLLALLAEEVALVEAELEQRVGSEVALVREVCEHTLRAGGKRLRPALVGLSAKTTGLPFDGKRARRLGACMEMIHMATLLHDDVIDRAETRRGVRTAAEVFGNTASILSGDVLLSKAMAILAEDGDLEIIRNVSRAVVDLAEGEVAELEARGSLDLDRERHFEILRMKTATFIQSCCEVGALAACASEAQVRALGTYGFHLGLAFQIADDLLDYRGDRALTGKPQATDFREGCSTLPLIRLLPALDPSEREFVSSCFGNGVTDGQVTQIVSWMEARGAFADVESEALEHARLGTAALEALPSSPARRLLESVSEFVVARNT